MTTFKPLYAAAGWADLTIGLASLPSSGTLVAGREGTAVDNTTDLFEDFIIGGNIRVGSTPTINTVIEGWIYTNVQGDSIYPDVLDGTDSDETITSAAIKRAAMAWAFSLSVDSVVSDRDYWIRPFSLVQVLGFIPQKCGLFVTHNTGVVLNATPGNHKISYIGVNGQSV